MGARVKERERKERKKWEGKEGKEKKNNGERGREEGREEGRREKAIQRLSKPQFPISPAMAQCSVPAQQGSIPTN